MDSDLLDLPLGVKIYVKPKSKPVFCRGKLGEKLQAPCLTFNLYDPYLHNFNLEYNCLHDPHLRDYHRRKDVLRLLKRRGGFLTSDNKVVCTLKEFNEYRMYLSGLKLQSEQILRQQGESKGIPLKSQKSRRVKIALYDGQTYSRAKLGTDTQWKPNNTANRIFEQLTAAEAQKLQHIVATIVHRVFARLKVPRDQRINFLRNAARRIRGSVFSRRVRAEPAETPLDYCQKMEMVAKELIATVLESLGNRLESKASEPGRAARQKEKPVGRGATRADKSKEAETASSYRARLHACLDKLTTQVVKNVHCLLKSMVASQFEGDSHCKNTEILELPKGKFSNRQMRPGFPGASKEQSQEASTGVKLPALGPQLHAEQSGSDNSMEPEDPATVMESLVGEGNPGTAGNTLDIRTMADRIIHSVLYGIRKCMPAPPPEENFQ